MIQIQIDPVALSDIEETSAWYESQRLGLGTEFILELDQLIERIGSSPRSFIYVYRIFRRALLQRFPYALYFTYDNDTLRVYAVLHQHRSSEFVSSRLT